MLIDSPRHSVSDMEHWRKREALDRSLWKLPQMRRRESEARREMVGFIDRGGAYVSVSWGKDSVVVAHLGVQLGVRLVWFPAGAIENPDCTKVRDAFLARYPTAKYEEHPAPLAADDWNRAIGHDGAQAEFERVARSVGERYICGVRAEESGIRRMSLRHRGLSTVRSCRPLGWWSTAEVFAYLAGHDLPVHPAYACTFGGAIERDLIRVSTIGGEGGTRFGRRQWERRYYSDALRGVARPKGL